MAEEKQSLWKVLFSGSSRSEREEKVLEYVIHRINDGAHLEDVLEEPYVQRNCSQAEIDELRSDPSIIHAARGQLEQGFHSGELDSEKRSR